MTASGIPAARARASISPARLGRTALPAKPCRTAPCSRAETVPSLSATLPGTWRLVPPLDRNAAGEVVPEPSLGSDPLALLIYDRSGHFAVQFMKRDRSG